MGAWERRSETKKKKEAQWEGVGRGRNNAHSLARRVFSALGCFGPSSVGGGCALPAGVDIIMNELTYNCTTKYA